MGRRAPIRRAPGGGRTGLGTWLAATLLGCDSSPSAMVVIEVVASAEVAGELSQIDVRVDAQPLTVPLSGTSPLCLPFSFSVRAAAPGTPLELELRGLDGEGRSAFERRIRTVVPEGSSLLQLPIEAACLRGTCPDLDGLVPDPLDVTEIEARLSGQPCVVPLGVAACLEEQGCFAEPGRAQACLRPCPVAGPRAPPTPPLPPVPPAPPDFIPCPPGFSVSADVPPECRPWPGGRPACEPDAHAFPGQGCAPLGRPCPDDDWRPSDADLAVYVRPGAARGLGTRERPFGTLDEALARGPEGALILLSAGRHPALSGPVDRALRVEGACSARTSLEGSLRLRGAAAVTGLTVEGELVLGGAAALEDLVVRGRLTAGASADVVSEGLVVEAAQVAAAGRWTGGRAEVKDQLDVADGGEVALTTFVLSDARARIAGRATLEGGAWFGSASEATVEPEGELRIAQSNLHDWSAEIALEVAGRLELDRVVVERFGGGFARVAGAFEGTDLILRGLGGPALVSEGGAIEAARVLVLAASDVAVQLLGTTTATLSDLRVVGTRPDPRERGGEAMEVIGQARLRLIRSLMEDNRKNAIAIFGPGPIELLDVAVDDTQPERSSGEQGRGLLVDAGADLFAERVRVRRSHHEGVSLRSHPERRSRVILRDLIVEDTTEAPGGNRGRAGLRIGGDDDDRSPDVKIERGWFKRNLSAGISSRNAELSLTDIRVEGTRAGTDSGTANAASYPGYGLVLQRRLRLVASRIAVAGTEDLGVVIEGPDAVGTLEELEISGTWTPEGGGGQPGGGLAAGFGAKVTAKDILLRGHASQGARIYVQAELDLEGGRIEDNAVGALVQAVGYDVRRLAIGVTYAGNQAAILVPAP